MTIEKYTRYKDSQQLLSCCRVTCPKHSVLPIPNKGGKNAQKSPNKNATESKVLGGRNWILAAEMRSKLMKHRLEVLIG